MTKKKIMIPIMSIMITGKITCNKLTFVSPLFPDLSTFHCDFDHTVSLVFEQFICLFDSV